MHYCSTRRGDNHARMTLEHSDRSGYDSSMEHATTNLTPEQSQALAAHPTASLRLVDPQTDRAYVLVPAEVFERIRAVVEDDFDIRDTYAAQFQSALRAGWGDPAMDDYDNYDDNYRKLCQSSEATSS